MSMFNFNNDRKHYCGKYEGIDVWQYGCMIGNGWYGVYYVTVKRGKSRRNMKVEASTCRSLEALKRYIDLHLSELKALNK